MADDSQKLYDTSMIEMIGRNSPSFVNQMIIMFVDLVSKDFDALKAAAVANNWTEVGQLAHKIKSSLGNMGISCILPQVRALEAGTGDRVQNLKEMDEGLNAVMTQMKADYKELFY